MKVDKGAWVQWWVRVNFFVARVGLGQPFMVWVWIWKISPKQVKFLNFLSFGSKKISSGQVRKYPGRRRVKSKLGSGRVRVHLYSWVVCKAAFYADLGIFHFFFSCQTWNNFSLDCCYWLWTFILFAQNFNLFWLFSFHLSSNIAMASAHCTGKN